MSYQSHSAPPSRPEFSRRGKILAGAVIAVLLVVWVISGSGLFEDTDTTVPTLTSAEANDLVDQLAAAEDVQGICYGWKLLDSSGSSFGSGNRAVDEGSSRGVGSSAETCDEWVVVEGSVNYTSASSELADSGTISVRTSSGLTGPSATDLAALDINEAALLEDPVSTVGYGALALPLLMAERGEAEPMPAVDDSAPSTSDTPAALPDVGFFERNTVSVLVIIFAGLSALGCVAVGWIIHRREKARLRPVPPQTERPV